MASAIRFDIIMSLFTHLGAKSASHPAAAASNGAAAQSSLRSKGLGLLRKLKMSVELLFALAALLSWGVVGVVMFDFVEYKAVPGRPDKIYKNKISSVH